MVDPRTLRRWLEAAGYLALCLVLIFLAILPIDVEAGRYPGPDLMLMVTFAIVLRRPRSLPAPLVAAVFLATDLLYMRPPGLWTALVLLGTEFLRGARSAEQEMSFAREWGMATATLIGVALGYRLALWLALVPQPPLGLVAAGLAATALSYPLAVLVVRHILRIRRASPAETDPRESHP